MRDGGRHCANWAVRLREGTDTAASYPRRETIRNNKGGNEGQEWEKEMFGQSDASPDVSRQAGHISSRKRRGTGDSSDGEKSHLRRPSERTRCREGGDTSQLNRAVLKGEH